MPETSNEVRVEPARRSRTLRAILFVSLLLVGIQLWLLSDFWLYRPLPRVLIYFEALAICFVPIVQRSLEAINRFLSVLSWKRTTAVVTLIVIASFAALYATARSSDRQFTPIFHDEFSYLLQARMFASGHLWMPAHPLADFFETFYVITDRVYAPQYFPGAALLLLPGALFGLPEWVMPLVIASVTCGAMYLLIRELFGGAVGLAGVVLLIGVLGFRVVSITAIAQIPAMLMASIALFALLRWDRERLTRWIVVAGFAMGWLAVTRPLEGVVCGVVFIAFIGWRLRGKPMIFWRRIAVAGLLPMLPFLALQLKINRGVTGRWLETPFTYYAERDMPGTGLGFRGFDPNVRPLSKLPQKQTFYDLQVVKAVREHTFERAVLEWPKRRFFSATTEIFPDMLLVIIVPAALLGLSDARRWLVLAIMPLWWAAYTLHVFTFAHYFVFYSSSIFVLIFAGFDGLASCLGPRGARSMRAMQVVMPMVISVLAMPQFKRDVRDQWFANPVELKLEQIIPTLPEPRVIVMVRYNLDGIPEHEVVYNVDTAWPDDARAIRAHDLGHRNGELYRYYAQRQPERVVYLFDRKDFTIRRLGNVVDLANGAVDDATTRPTIGRETSGDLKK